MNALDFAKFETKRLGTWSHKRNNKEDRAT